MTYVFINDNKVIKIVDCTEDEALSQAGNFQAVTPIESFSRTPSVGWIWSGGLCRPDIKDITPRQARQALVLSGISLESIESAMDLLPEPMKSMAKIEWEYSTAFIRTNQLMDTMGAMLGLTVDQIDQLFIFGAKL